MSILEEVGESLDGFIDRHLRKMSSNIKETTSDDIVEKRSAHKSLTPRQSKTITAISKKYGIPPAAVVSRLIIYPALKAFYDRNGY